jgi:hypothetical protein
VAHHTASVSALGHARAARIPVTAPLYVCFIFLLCQPYIQWFGFGTPSDVQLYPVLLALPFLAHQLLSNARGRRFRRVEPHVDPLLLGLTAAVLPIAVVQFLLTAENSAFGTLRGIFSYLSVGILTWTWVWIIRAAGPEITVFGLKVTFWVWTTVGAVQLVRSDFGVFWRQKLIITSERGSLSFGTEPAYFAFALLLIALAIALLTGSSRYLIFATLVIALVAQSSVGIVYCLVVALFAVHVSRKRKLMLLSAVTGLWLAAVMLLPSARIAVASRALLTEPFALIAFDKSVGLRYINLVFPIRGFIENRGLPHGLTAWSDFQWHAFLADPRVYYWRIDYVAGATGRILSIHGQLLFELGAYALVYYLLFWKIIRRSDHPFGLAAICMVIFVNGVTLNSPFLALVLAAAYVQRELPATPAESTPAPQDRLARATS